MGERSMSRTQGALVKRRLGVAAGMRTVRNRYVRAWLAQGNLVSP